MSIDKVIAFMFFAVMLSAVTYIIAEKVLEHIKGVNLKSIMYSIGLLIFLLGFSSTLYLSMRTIFRKW